MRRSLRAVLCSLSLGFSVILTGCGGSSGGSSAIVGGGTTAPESNPAPALSSISPATATEGSAQMTLTLTGTNFVASSVAQWNGSALATNYVSGTSLTAIVPASYLTQVASASITVSTPAPGGGASTPQSFSITAPKQNGIIVLPLTGNSVTWDPNSQKLYVSVPGFVSNGNIVEAVDPISGALGAANFAGSEPGILSVSSTGKYLYVALNGTNQVQRMTLPDLTSNLAISLGSGGFGPYNAGDLQASPVSDTTFAATRITPGFSPAEEGGVVIYDDATSRPDRLCGWVEGACNGNGFFLGLYDTMQWSGDGTQLFLGNNEDTGFDFYTAAVTAAGVQKPLDYPQDLLDFFELIHYDATTQLIYTDSGRVIDPTSGNIVGTFDSGGSMVPDGADGKVYFLGQTIAQLDTHTYSLESFDIRHFTPIDTMTISNVYGSPQRLIRWGSHGLAFLTYGSGTVATNGDNGSDLYLISDSSFVGPAVAVKVAPSLRVQKGKAQGVSRGVVSGPLP